MKLADYLLHRENRFFLEMRQGEPASKAEIYTHVRQRFQENPIHPSPFPYWLLVWFFGIPLGMGGCFVAFAAGQHSIQLNSQTTFFAEYLCIGILVFSGLLMAYAASVFVSTTVRLIRKMEQYPNPEEYYYHLLIETGNILEGTIVYDSYIPVSLNSPDAGKILVHYEFEAPQGGVVTSQFVTNGQVSTEKRKAVVLYLNRNFHVLL